MRNIQVEKLKGKEDKLERMTERMEKKTKKI